MFDAKTARAGKLVIAGNLFETDDLRLDGSSSSRAMVEGDERGLAQHADHRSLRLAISTFPSSVTRLRRVNCFLNLSFPARPPAPSPPKPFPWRAASATSSTRPMAWITLPSRSFASESPGFPVSPQDAAHYAHLRPRRTVKLRWERHVYTIALPFLPPSPSATVLAILPSVIL